MPRRSAAASGRRAIAVAMALALGSALACSAKTPSETDVGVKVAEVALDPLSNTPVIVLQEKGGPRRLLIWIGLAEAQSIAQQLARIDSPRPNTHDLAERLVEGLEGNVERVTVTDLRQGTYYAVIVLRQGGRRVEIDARPSDAIALALRAGAPVLVREDLLESPEPEPEAPAPSTRPEVPERRT